ncbi:hypothetical protein AaE_009437 [Aphanomyces astaci]|uniref:Uncharacterized protein n=1 Tax=Aphanomyces astaci TaxID=112090 RepID=A0A6A5AAG9_APHAT|nr:hypothetical protein AaE_009437 [Aphanomyces astaci]
MSTPPRSFRELTEETKLDVSIALQELARLGKLPRGTINMVATRFGIDRSTVRKVWRCYQQGSMKSRKKGRVGRKHRHKIQDIIAKIREVPQGQRTTMRDLSLATGLSISTLSRALHKGIMTRRSSRLKPLLTDANKNQRMDFCSSHAVLTEDDVAAYRSTVTESVAPLDDPATVAEGVGGAPGRKVVQC